MRLYCFKCRRELREDDRVVFSEEWDALCHIKCCPAYTAVKVDEECKCCEVWRRGRAEYGPGSPSEVIREVRGIDE